MIGVCHADLFLLTEIFVGGYRSSRYVLQVWDVSQKHAALPTRCSRQIRKDCCKLALRAYSGLNPFGPPGTMHSSLLPATAPYGSYAIVFVTHPTPAVLYT